MDLRFPGATAAATAMGFIANALPVIRMVNVFLIFYTLANLCSPVRAAALRAAGKAPAGPAADLVLKAAAPWSPATHELFPAAARRAAMMARFLARVWGTGTGGWSEVWMEAVFGLLVRR